jgi:peptide/nickel transport system permease protein
LPVVVLVVAGTGEYSRVVWAAWSGRSHEGAGPPDNSDRLFNILGLALGGFWASFLVVEPLFAWPGVGRAIIDAILRRDYFVIWTVAILTSLGVLLTKTLLDILHTTFSGAPSGRTGNISASARAFERASIRHLLTQSQKSSTQFNFAVRAESALDLLRLRVPDELTTPHSYRWPSIEAALGRLQAGIPMQPRQHARGLNKTAGVILLLIVFVSLFASVINQVSGIDPMRVGSREMFLPIGSPGHLLGTDQLGRDLLARLLVGGQISLGLAFITTIISAGVGWVFAFVANAGGETIKWIVRWFLAVFSTVPILLVPMLITAFHKPGLDALGVGLVLVGWPYAAGLWLASWNEQLNLQRILTLVAKTAGTLLLIESSLSFLGLGVVPPAASWGSLVTTREISSRAFSSIILPGAIILITTLCLYSLGESSDGAA